MDLKDENLLKRIVTRISRARMGNFGDSKPVGEGIYEMRIDYAGGFRVYYKQTGKVIYLLLCAGDKSTQSKDIDKAKEIAASLKDED